MAAGKSKLQTLVLWIGAVVALVLFLLLATPLSYLYCLARESSWMRAKTQTELENRLIVFYSKKSISPPNSIWGGRHVLKDGQQMIQYAIFWKEPLDVVYNSDGSIAAVYTSYE